MITIKEFIILKCILSWIIKQVNIEEGINGININGIKSKGINKNVDNSISRKIK